MVEMTCLSCGKQLQYLEESKAWYCLQCDKIFTPPSRDSSKLEEKSERPLLDKKDWKESVPEATEQVQFIPIWKVPGEQILWQRDLTRGIINRKRVVEERITNMRIFQYDVENNRLLSQLPIKDYPDVVVTNVRRNSDSLGGGSFVSSYGVGVYSGSRSGTSRSIGDVVIMEDGVICATLSRVVDPHGVKRLIDTVKREAKNAEKTKMRSMATPTAGKVTEYVVKIGKAELDIPPKSENARLDYMKNNSVEQLIEDFVAFVKKEYPEAETAPSWFPYSATQAFWVSKGIANRYSIDPELKLKMERVETIARERLTMMRATLRSKLEKELAEECLKWAKENGMKRITKVNVDTFLSEREQTVSGYGLIRGNYAISRDIIHSLVNMRLSQERS